MIDPETEHQLDDLRNKIDLLQKEKKTWYLDPSYISLFLSIFAILLSAWATLDARFSKTAEENRSKRMELRQVVEKIIDFQFDPAKSALYVGAAELLMEKIHDFISSEEYFAVANAKFISGDFSNAEVFYRKSVEASNRQSLISQVVALRALAIFYFNTSPKNLENGRKAFNDALKLSNNQNDNYMNFTSGLTCHQWGLSELYNDPKEGEKYIELVRTYYRNLPNNYPNKNQLIDNLEKNYRQVKEQQGQTPQKPRDKIR